MRIAIIDSGKGGKYIEKELKAKLGNRKSIKFVRYEPPVFESYGNCSLDRLVQLSNVHINFLKTKKPDLVIIGCMTLSTNLGSYIKRHFYGTKVLSLYDSIMRLPLTDKVVLATPNSLKSGKFNGAIQVPCPLLSSLIENGSYHPKHLLGLLRGFKVSYKVNANDKIIIVGCSHYSWVKKEIKEVFQPAYILDPCDIVCEEAFNYIRFRLGAWRFLHDIKTQDFLEEFEEMC